MNHRKWKKILGIALIGLLALTIFGQVVLQLWNWLMPVIFGLPRLTFAQALGLMALSWILFGGLRGPGGRRCRWRGHRGHRYRNFAAESLSPEDRERFRQKLQGRCGRENA